MSFVTALKIYVEYLISILIWSILNPFGLVQTLRQTAGQFIAIGRSVIRGVIYEDTVAFLLPFEGAWKVVNGGVHKQTSHSWNLIGQRYAYDFVITDHLGKTYQHSSSKPENYYAFGKSILAASNGIVQEVRDNIRDYNRAGTGWIDVKTPDIRGNYVVIKHSPNLYTLYAHLKSGSISVKTGEAVVAGQKIGECGHSGHSSEPHLHFQLQDRPDFFTAVSLPVRFSNYERVKNTTQECVELGFVEKDQVVRKINSCSSGITETADFISPKISDLVQNFLILFFTILGIIVVLARIAELILKIIL